MFISVGNMIRPFSNFCSLLLAHAVVSLAATHQFTGEGGDITDPHTFRQSDNSPRAAIYKLDKSNQDRGYMWLPPSSSCQVWPSGSPRGL